MVLDRPERHRGSVIAVHGLLVTRHIWLPPGALAVYHPASFAFLGWGGFIYGALEGTVFNHWWGYDGLAPRHHGTRPGKAGRRAVELGNPPRSRATAGQCRTQGVRDRRGSDDRRQDRRQRACADRRPVQ